jgi:fatty-acyl-CoA synthase
MAGAVLNSLNIRLDAAAIAFQLGHGAAKVVLVDPEFAPVVAEALELLPKRPIVIDISDATTPASEPIGVMNYESFVALGDENSPGAHLENEWQAISLNYTSGTTGNPKGVIYHHRGAYLNAIGNVLAWNMPLRPVYLWTLPMFHCNGWCFPWTIALQAGTNVCLRKITAEAIFKAVEKYGVSHLCGAPVVMNMLLNAQTHEKRDLPNKVQMMTAGSSPPAAVILGLEAMGFDVIHVYGLTEVYGPATVCAWQPAWDILSSTEKARMKSLQGAVYPTEEALMVANPVSLQPVPRDGETLGEIFLRGNSVMKGYLKNPDATREAFEGGWFHTGDLGVWHPNGYIEVKDRSKDIIISGGENISTIEVEGVLYEHPAVLEAAVVQKPDEKWGEIPCAFIMLKEGASATPAELIDYCRGRLARYKVPRKVVFGPLPKTSTGKVQKYLLRELARTQP